MCVIIRAYCLDSFTTIAEGVVDTGRWWVLPNSASGEPGLLSIIIIMVMLKSTTDGGDE